MISHREAVEYDLITKTNYTLKDVGRSLTWSELASFMSYVGADSALARDIDLEKYLWATPAMTNTILADIFDVLAQINANLVAIGSGKRASIPDPYPRPGAKRESGNTRHFGRGALPPDELREWFEEKRRARNGRND